MKSSHRRDIAAGHIPTERKPSLQWCDYFTLEFYGWLLKGHPAKRVLSTSNYYDSKVVFKSLFTLIKLLLLLQYTKQK